MNYYNHYFFPLKKNMSTVYLEQDCIANTSEVINYHGLDTTQLCYFEFNQNKLNLAGVSEQQQQSLPIGQQLLGFLPCNDQFFNTSSGFGDNVYQIDQNLQNIYLIGYLKKQVQLLNERVTALENA